MQLHSSGDQKLAPSREIGSAVVPSAAALLPHRLQLEGGPSVALGDPRPGVESYKPSNAWWECCAFRGSTRGAGATKEGLHPTSKCGGSYPSPGTLTPVPPWNPDPCPSPGTLTPVPAPAV